MNEQNFSLLEKLVDSAYIAQGQQARKNKEHLIRELLIHKSLPLSGWSEQTIEFFISELSLLDSNNFLHNIGAGEREARIYSSLVAKRHFYLGHGIGRSGELCATQPKAAGSSVLLKLATSLTLHALKLAGLVETKACLLTPLATGMGLVLSFLAVKSLRPKAKFIIWPRIDQQTCFKAIFTAGFIPIVIENVLEGDELRTDVKAIERCLNEIDNEEILALVTTSSCFAPRAPDRLIEVAKMCRKHSVPHIINNAYGVQAKDTCALITSAMRKGRVDVYVQSTDKNFLVPVGGSVLASGDESLIGKISKIYPGRASMSPIFDVFVTLLAMGQDGWKELLHTREELRVYFRSQLETVAKECGERVLETQNNPISFGMTLDSFGSGDMKDFSMLGSMLFSRCVSGPRSVPQGTKKTINGVSFIGYGSHCDHYSHPYLALACAIGQTKEEVDALIARLRKTIGEFRKKQAKPKPRSSSSSSTSSSSSFSPSLSFAGQDDFCSFLECSNTAMSNCGRCEQKFCNSCNDNHDC